MAPAWVWVLLLQGVLSLEVNGEDDANSVALDVKSEELHITHESLRNESPEGTAGNRSDIRESAPTLNSMEENTDLQLIPGKSISKRSKTRLIRKKRTFSKHKCIMCGVLSHIMKHKMYQPQPQPQPVYYSPPQTCDICGPPPQQVYHPPPQPQTCNVCGGNHQPMYHQPPPQPVYHQPAPQPVYHQPAPQPVYHQPAPQPVYYQPAPQPVYHQPAPQPVYHQPQQPTCDPCQQSHPSGYTYSEAQSSASSKTMSMHKWKKK